MADHPPMCRAGRDGECFWQHCPQEALKRRGHCPLDILYHTYCDEEGFLSRKHEAAWAAAIASKELASPKASGEKS